MLRPAARRTSSDLQAILQVNSYLLLPRVAESDLGEVKSHVVSRVVLSVVPRMMGLDPGGLFVKTCAP